MSMKLVVSRAASTALCEQLKNTEVLQNKVKKSNFLEKNPRNQCHNKMKGYFNSVLDLQAKYVSLDEYKKFSCLNIDKLVPELKVAEEEDELSEAKQE